MQIEINGTEVTANGKSTMMRLMHVKLLEKFRDKYPAVIPEQELMELTGVVARHTLTQHISTLRKKLNELGGIEIVTHPKIGYALKYLPIAE
jgi:DNA-binding winged helix-turn-helix (wHTH) protein